MTGSRSPPPAVPVDTQTTGNKNEISHYQRQILKRSLIFNERFTHLTVAYQFFEGSRLHVVGIWISVLQCITTLLREQRQCECVETWTFMHEHLCLQHRDASLIKINPKSQYNLQVKNEINKCMCRVFRREEWHCILLHESKLMIRVFSSDHSKFGSLIT